VAQKRHLGTDGSTSSPSVAADDVYEDSDDESEMTVRMKALRYIRQGLYYVTDSEKFRPPRKRPKYVISRSVNLLQSMGAVCIRRDSFSKVKVKVPYSPEPRWGANLLS